MKPARTTGLEPVRDLWPRNLMAARSGAAADPVRVIRPETYDEVAAALAEAAASNVSLVPVGGRTGVCGAVDLQAAQLALDMTGLDRVLEVDRVNLLCRVQAGIRLAGLEAELNRTGLTLGHHPTSIARATVGGAISTRSSGQESTRYGGVEEMLLGVLAMRADGTLLPMATHPRSAAGPALHQLLVGAEGGLAVILEATLRIGRLPDSVNGRGYRFDRLDDGLAAMREIVQCGLRPLVLRLYDPDDSLFQGLDSGCLMVVATAGNEDVAAAETRLIRRICAGAGDLGEEPWRRWSAHRYDLSAQRLLDMMEPPGAVLETIELGAHWTALSQLHATVRAGLQGLGVILCHFSHPCPQGCCAYFTFAGHGEDEAEARAIYDRFWQVAMEAAARSGATISHHHGVGQARAPWIDAEQGAWRRVWQELRHALDPDDRLNPRAVGGL